MATISEALAIAVQHHQGGRLQAAEQIYRQILQAEPNQADAIHLLGVIAHQMGRHEVAVEYIERAIGLKGNTAAFHANLGAAYFALHRIPQAVACYRRAVELKPDFAEAHGNLGNLLRELGNLDEAVVCYRRAVELMPDVAAAHNNLGNALFDQGKPDEAIECFRRALELKPEFAEAHNSLGAAIKNLGKLDEAVACYRRALELNPDYAAVHSNLGTVLKDQGKLDEAIVCYRRALALNPDFAEAHNNLGIAFKDQGKLEEAVVCCRRALALKSDYAEAHSNLGIALKEQRKLDEAIACFRRALELKPDFPTFLDNLLRPLQDTCCWKDLKALSARLIEIVDRYGDSGIPFSVPPFTFLTLPTITTAEQQLRYARNWVDRQLKAIGEPVDNLARHRPSKPKSKITIAYLSADFHSHATAWLIAEMIEKHDRDRFAVLGYSFGPDDRSPTRQRLVGAFDRFVDVKDAAFATAAERIAADGVDILVDLKGYTKDARTEILSLRPAPIQVNYLGYPGTMGAEFMDYILVDDYVVPSDQHPFFTEKLVYLPGCYQVNDSRREISGRTPSREECKLPADGFVFCSFNNNYK
ncbi:MAG: tetratricopeptide repeat protein, partial [Planctomycetota bacterium]